MAAFFFLPELSTRTSHSLCQLSSVCCSSPGSGSARLDWSVDPQKLLHSSSSVEANIPRTPVDTYFFALLCLFIFLLLPRHLHSFLGVSDCLASVIVISQSASFLLVICQWLWRCGWWMCAATAAAVSPSLLFTLNAQITITCESIWKVEITASALFLIHCYFKYVIKSQILLLRQCMSTVDIHHTLQQCWSHSLHIFFCSPSNSI